MGKSLNAKFAAAAAFVILFALIMFFSFKGMAKVYILRNERLDIRREIKEIKKNNKKISRQIHELTYNKQYIAGIAREKLNMIKKGEIVFKFIGKKRGANGKGKPEKK